MAYKCGYNILDDVLLVALGEGATEAEAKKATNKAMIEEIKKSLDEALSTPCPSECTYQTFSGGIDPNPWTLKCVKHKGKWVCLTGTNFFRVVRCRNLGFKSGTDYKAEKVSAGDMKKHLAKLELKLGK